MSGPQWWWGLIPVAGSAVLAWANKRLFGKPLRCLLGWHQWRDRLIIGPAVVVAGEPYTGPLGRQCRRCRKTQRREYPR